ncbi:MAG: cation-translocating P-type ATPase [Burkholderiales bacterium]|nr:cation-translocating P-type ATPase [Burkholderiales bacterium]
MQADPLIAPDPAASATLDDPLEQGGYTSWSSAAGGERIAQSHFRLSGLYCAACAGLIEHALGAEPGVIGAEVSYATQRATVRWNPRLTRPSRLVAAVQRAGYGASPDLAEPARALRRREQRAALWRLFVAVFCTMQVMMYAAPAYVAAPGSISPDLLRLLQWASWLLSIPVLLFSAAPMFRDAWDGVLHRQVRMDLPVAIGLIVTFVASTGATFAPGGVFGREVYFDSLTMFVSFLLGGRYLTLIARHRVAASLEAALTRLPPDVHRVEPDGRCTAVPLRALRVGDRVRVLAGEAFVADGALLEGCTQADEALLTGESRPVAKRPGDPVVAGSLNLTAPVTMRVERLGADTRFEAVVALMRGALTQRPALVRTADRVAVPFLWGVLVLAALAGAAWSFIDPARAVWVAVSVLIVTCPCALSLAAPSALLAAAGALARRGVLVQRLDAFEALAKVDTLYFDKTGTLTDDRMQLQRVHLLPAADRAGLDAASVLGLAGSLALNSAHPLSKALARDLVAPDAVWSDVVEVPGRGLQGAAWDGSLARLGARAWVDPNGAGRVRASDRPRRHANADAGGAVGAPPADPSAARVWFGDARGALAWFEFGEALKPDAAAALAALRGSGVALALLSGDAPERVRLLAEQLHLADAQGGATPEIKLARLAAAQHAGHCVGMVGDGLNDAPVIARADVSFAFAQGAAITQSKADFILLSGRVADVALARDVAGRAMRVLRQNLGWALVYNAVCVPLALLGWFPPWAAGLGMATSSLVVVLNALRIDAAPRRA